MTELDDLRIKAEEAKRLMEETRGHVPADIATYVQATLEYGVAQVREEYTRMAKHNRGLIERFSRRTVILLSVLTVVLLLLAGESVNLQLKNGDQSHNTAQIVREQKKARANSIIVSCEEANWRHDTLVHDIGIIVGRSPQPKTTPAQKKLNAENLTLFENALAPEYVQRIGDRNPELEPPLIKKHLDELEEKLGCKARLAQFSKP